MANKRNIFCEEKGYSVGALVVTFQLYIKRHWRLDRMYGKRDKRQIKSNIKLDEFSRDSEQPMVGPLLVTSQSIPPFFVFFMKVFWRISGKI